MELVIASSSTVDGGIGCWDLKTGTEQLQYRSCASPPHGLICVGKRLLASSQVRESNSSGSIFYWSWNKPQVEVKSFPAESIKPLVSNRDGSYIIGGGSSGYIYLWEVAGGKLLKKWSGHYRAVTCLSFSDDESLLISGFEDGCVRVWSLFMIFDGLRREEANHLYVHSFHEHTLRVTDIVSFGSSNAIIASVSEDCTCKVWSLSEGTLIGNIVFSSKVYSLALDPSDHALYAGCMDGKIYIAALKAESSRGNNYQIHLTGSLTDHR